MSRIGKHPVTIPDGVKVALSGQEMTVSGKLGELSRKLPDEVEVKQEDGSVTVSPRGEDKRSRHVGHVAHAGLQHGRPVCRPALPVIW